MNLDANRELNYSQTKASVLKEPAGPWASKYLMGRLERGQALPQVEVVPGMGGSGMEEEALRGAVAEYVMGDMLPELLMELLGLMGV